MTAVAKLFHPFLALIASATDRELAKYLDYLKEENKILRARLPGKQVHTTAAERERLLQFGKPLGRAIEELITIVKPATFYRWCRDGVGPAEAQESQGGSTKASRAPRVDPRDRQNNRLWLYEDESTMPSYGICFTTC